MLLLVVPRLLLFKEQVYKQLEAGRIEGGQRYTPYRQVSGVQVYRCKTGIACQRQAHRLTYL
jgi:hypothetical protein